MYHLLFGLNPQPNNPLSQNAWNELSMNNNASAYNFQTNTVGTGYDAYDNYLYSLHDSDNESNESSESTYPQPIVIQDGVKGVHNIFMPYIIEGYNNTLLN